MAVPKKRMTSTRSGNRRSHQSIKIHNLGKCLKCKEPVIPHHVCLVCGSYKNDQVIDFSNRDKKEKDINKKNK